MVDKSAGEPQEQGQARGRRAVRTLGVATVRELALEVSIRRPAVVQPFEELQLVLLEGKDRGHELAGLIHQALGPSDHLREPRRDHNQAPSSATKRAHGKMSIPSTRNGSGARLTTTRGIPG